MRKKIIENVLDYSDGANTVFHDGKTYYIHPIHTKYGCSKDGYIINSKKLIPRKGNLQHNGYLLVSVKSDDNKQKRMQAHRFVYECFHGVIPNGMVIDHINDIKDDNRIKNLQMMTQQENCLKSAKKRDYAFAATNHKNRRCVKAINCKTNEINYYHSIYKTGKELGINPGIIKMVAEGLNMCKTAISKMNQQAYIFEYIDENELPSESVPVKWRKQTFTCPNCNKQMQNGSKYNHKKSCRKPIESNDEFTEDEKVLIDKKYNTIINKIKNGNFPYKKHLQEHLPNIEFW